MLARCHKAVVAELIPFDCFSSRGEPYPSPQPLHEPGQAGRSGGEVDGRSVHCLGGVANMMHSILSYDALPRPARTRPTSPLVPIATRVALTANMCAIS